MTPVSIAIAVALFLATIYAYLVFPVWVAIVCAKSTAASKRAKTLWLIVCIVLAPVGSWAYCIFTPQRWPFRVTAWLSLAGTIALVWFVTAFTNAEADAVREHVEAVAPRLQRAQMAISPSPRAAITGALDTLRREIHGGVLSFRKTDAASAVVDLLDAFLQDGRLTPAECDEWLARFKSRRVLDAGALERRVQAAGRDST
jgi:hypothetical protein